MNVLGGGAADHIQEPLCLSLLERQRLSGRVLLRKLLKTGLSDQWPHPYH